VSTTGHEDPCGKRGRPRSKATYPLRRPIVDQYREGPVKSTPARGVKEYLKPAAHTQSEGCWPRAWPDWGWACPARAGPRECGAGLGPA
jgi:hypothetical protein